ncbi:Unannotated [Lentimonas sp. CC4]|nr:Unannotated [Lentimonas sp. CC4]CAA6683707.1 Unannotated [Lentimonas sp. CC6]CAA7074445.1 Unannotated [Lentimonas sp. CC4]CAA7169055.1 Unannotated [Lentimonas sp. CC21]CAA7180537.1 Unannotated [Lentimonas sp. CC8]
MPEWAEFSLIPEVGAQTRYEKRTSLLRCVLKKSEGDSPSLVVAVGELPTLL